MSRESVDFIRRAYDAFNRGDLDTAFALMHPEIEYHTYEQAPEAGVYRGRDSVRRYNERLFAGFESVRQEIERITEVGELVLVVTRQRARPRGADAEINVRFVELYKLRDGKIVERRSYSSEEDALEAAGLSE